MDEERESRRPLGSELACTFCGQSQFEARKLIAGSSGYICDGCIELAGGVISSGTAAGTLLGELRAAAVQDGQACSFCGKPRYRVDGMAALSAGTGGRSSGPAAICSECLDLCNEILAE